MAGALSRLSISQKLSLAVFSLLLLVTSAFMSAAYVQGHREARAVNADRLRTVTRQLHDLLRNSGLQLGAQARAIAARAPVGAFVGSPSSAARAAAVASLRYTGPNAEQVRQVELRDARDSVLIAASDSGAPIARPDFGPPPRLRAGDSVVVGTFRAVHDTVVYPVAARVRGTRNYVVVWRRLGTTGGARQQLTRLIGSDATVLLGNADRTLWTDLDGILNRPPAGRSGDDTTGTVFDAGVVIASQLPIAGTSWLVRVEIPKEAVDAPVVTFLRRMAVIALLFLILGLAIAWAIGRRISAPLQRLTEAADSLAAGRRPESMPSGGGDEVGRLATSFGIMAGQIEEARQVLEHRVEERTRELHQALAEVHEMQDALVRREKLAMLGQLASGVGHELRNPLGVMTNAVFYLEAVLSQAPKNVREYLEILRLQIALSERIVSDLLDFARIRSPQREDVSLATLVRAQLGRTGTPDRVRIDEEIPRDLPPAHVDPVQMGQVLLNLLTNALQAMNGSGGVLTVRARRDGTQRVVLEVSDTGPGVPPEHVAKIFEPLFTTKARGIGLGLAVSRGLALANDGDLTLENPAGPTTFRLTMPATASAGVE